MLVVPCLISAASANVTLPSIFSDHMVLQRGINLPVWGVADPGERIIVTVEQNSPLLNWGSGGIYTIDKQLKNVTADSRGKWSIVLDPLMAAGPVVFMVQGRNSLALKDVLAGEVWLCSGQSNMEMRVDRARNNTSEMRAANYYNIRGFTVPEKAANMPQPNATSKWIVCSPETVGSFSATSYFFGRELNKQLDEPIGLIQSSYGGTPIEAWTSVSAQKAVPELANIIDSFNETVVRFNKTAINNITNILTANSNISPMSPGRLYDGMIAPLAPYAIRGAIWYQGESNIGDKIYGLQLKTLIANWRQDWLEGDFPFLFVQLPNYGRPQIYPSEGVEGWQLLREAFLKTLAVPNTGMAVTIDIGEGNNVHPENKQDVGKRLAQWALAKVYSKDLVASGPLYKSMQKQGSKIVLQFDYVNDGLMFKGDTLKGFAIAGEDKKFVWGDARIEQDSVVVSSPMVSNPVAVRYAWASNPSECNLYNKAGLPASPFRTDDWL